MRKVQVAIKSLEEMRKQSINLAQGVERAEIKETEYYLNFESLEALQKVLTPKRYDVLRVLKHKLARASVAELARAVQRDYKNVSVDVKALDEAGLVERNGNMYTVPYDVIESSITI